MIVERDNKPRPVVGVLVNKLFFFMPGGKLFAAKLMQANEKAPCSIYFFPPENIDWRSKRIKGYVYQKEWVGGWWPFPHIIYDRGAGFKNLDKVKVDRIRQRFQRLPEIQFINSGRLEKWKVYEKLSRFDEVKKYLPETIIYRHFRDIREMLARHRTVFLKTSGGSGGRGVFSIENRSDGFYLYFYYAGTHHARVYPALNAIKPFLDRITRGGGPLVVQQGIHLVKLHGRRLDLRVLMVKDKTGDWRAVYNQARMAKKGAMVTNLSLGGSVTNYSDIYPALKASYPGIPEDGEIRHICARISRCIETALGPYGEMGMDVAIDEEGNAWLLEANSKPSKLPEKNIEDNTGISPQFLATLEYARLLYSRS